MVRLGAELPASQIMYEVMRQSHQKLQKLLMVLPLSGETPKKPHNISNASFSSTARSRKCRSQREVLRSVTIKTRKHNLLIGNNGD